MLTTAAGFAILLAFFFEAINGFHDTAHASATSVASGVFAKPITVNLLFTKFTITPPEWCGYWIPVGLACIFNFLGAYFGGTAVALFIPKIIHFSPIPMRLVMATLIAAAGWNLFTWWRKIPVSSTHCLIGALTGAGIAAAATGGVGFKELGMAIAALCAAPFIAYFLSLVLAKLLKLVFGMPGAGGRGEFILRWLQVVSSCMVSMAHGRNDGQKTMGIIVMIIAISSGTAIPTAVPHWVIFACALCMGIGTAIGAGRIIFTVGHKLSNKPLSFHDGLAAETVTAGLIHGASFIGLPLSTTQTCTSGVLGAAAGIHNEKALAWATFKKLFIGTWADKKRRALAFIGIPLPVQNTDAGSVLEETSDMDETSTMNVDTVRRMVTMWVYTFFATWIGAQLIYALLTWLQIG
jgi:PiT family inorganic phosphate transporter